MNRDYVLYALSCYDQVYKHVNINCIKQPYYPRQLDIATALIENYTGPHIFSPLSRSSSKKIGLVLTERMSQRHLVIVKNNHKYFLYIKVHALGLVHAQVSWQSVSP